MAINANRFPWIEFQATTWLASRTVKEMTMAERGIYITLLAINWRDGEIIWDAAQLSKDMAIDKRTIGKWMEKYGKLTVGLPDVSGKSRGSLTETSRKVTFRKLAEIAEKPGKTSPCGSLHN